ncbi:MAG: SpoIID/LytB domain-containing protein [Candidatus Levybacteria bacterium]|nr:SpoIID/LytB domain-containing protein [Candidatus Levybacteria bacterium]
MKRLLILCIALIFIGGFFFLAVPKTSSDELADINKQINELTQALDMSIKATKPLESQLNSLRSQIDDIKKRVFVIEGDIIAKKKNIDEGYKNLERQEKILARTIRNFYIKSYYNSPLLTFLSAQSASEITQILAYQKAAADQDKAIITNIALTISDLETKKKNLESEQARLAVIKADLSEQSAKLDKIVSGAKAYQTSLSTQIAQLSARQQQILAQRLAGLNLPTSLGAGPLFCTDDRKIDPGFSPAFAFYTFGIPHRVGMNQYGALGRSQAGQSHEDILRAYFEGISFETKGNINIKVQGYGEMPLEQYLLGIYEMPESWPIEALKAQVIAARSYALAYTDNGAREICTTQQCQVYKGGNKGGNWERAARETEGKIMTNSGQIITAWYASTAGGYTFKSGDVGWSDRPWTKRVRDTTADVTGFSDLLSTAYDKESPCFYSAQGFRNQYGKSAWLKQNEVADIVNIILLARQDSSIREHLYQTDKPNPAGTDTWDEGRVKQELQNRNITAYNTISDFSIDWDKGVGRTTSVRINGDGGTQVFDGGEFKNFFNLRAPANIQIVGPLYNIERR